MLSVDGQLKAGSHAVLAAVSAAADTLGPCLPSRWAVAASVTGSAVGSAAGSVVDLHRATEDSGAVAGATSRIADSGGRVAVIGVETAASAARRMATATRLRRMAPAGQGAAATWTGVATIAETSRLLAVGMDRVTAAAHTVTDLAVSAAAAAVVAAAAATGVIAMCGEPAATWSLSGPERMVGIATVMASATTIDRATTTPGSVGTKALTTSREKFAGTNRTLECLVVGVFCHLISVFVPLLLPWVNKG